jgi:hypothetical protein
MPESQIEPWFATARPECLHASDRPWSGSEATDADTDCAAYCVATERLERHGQYRADCQGTNAAAISRAEGCS